EPAVDRGEKIASLTPFAPIAPEPRHANRCPQLPRLCLLPACDRQRALEIHLRFGRIRLWRLERDFPGHPMDIGLEPRFPGCFDYGHRLVNAAPSVIELANFSMSARQVRQKDWYKQHRAR